MINNHSSDMANVVNDFEVLAEWIASVINVLQKCVKAIVSSSATLLAWHACRIIAKCERHGRAQVQYGECHLSALSPCCPRRIRPSRPMSPIHHRALLAKHCRFTEVELDFFINYDIKCHMSNWLNKAA